MSESEARLRSKLESESLPVFFLYFMTTIFLLIYTIERSKSGEDFKAAAARTTNTRELIN